MSCTENSWEAYISDVILACEYLLLIAITAYCFRGVKDKQARSKWQFWFIIIFFISCLGRATYFILQPFESGDTSALVANLDFILSFFPSLIYLTCYLILLYVLAETYYHPIRISNFGNKGFSASSLIAFFWVINILLYTSTIALSIASAIYKRSDSSTQNNHDHNNVFQNLVLIILAANYLLASFGFLYFGYGVYKDLRNLAMDSDKKKRMQKQLLVMIILVPICFISRAIIMFLQLFVSVIYCWYFNLFYYSTMEVFPLAMILLISLRIITRNNPEAEGVLASINYA